jgi:RNA polymerase sigma factor (sigma-70 family)
LRPKFDSEDFVQAVWASFFADFGHLGARCQIRDIAADLAAIAKHKTIDEVRRRLHTRKRVIYREVAWHRCGEARLAAVHKRLPEPMEAAEAKEAWSRLARGRSERSVQIFEMRRGGASHVEIAQHLGVNERTVRRVLDRAERRMKKRP